MLENLTYEDLANLCSLARLSLENKGEIYNRGNISLLKLQQLGLASEEYRKGIRYNKAFYVITEKGEGLVAIIQDEANEFVEYWEKNKHQEEKSKPERVRV